MTRPRVASCPGTPGSRPAAGPPGMIMPAEPKVGDV